MPRSMLFFLDSASAAQAVPPPTLSSWPRASAPHVLRHHSIRLALASLPPRGLGEFPSLVLWWLALCCCFRASSWPALHHHGGSLLPLWGRPPATTPFPVWLLMGPGTTEGQAWRPVLWPWAPGSCACVPGAEGGPLLCLLHTCSAPVFLLRASRVQEGPAPESEPPAQGLWTQGPSALGSPHLVYCFPITAGHQSPRSEG